MTGFLGILRLDTRFPRPLGDIGNAQTFAFPVRHAIVSGASPQRVVRERANSLLEPFITAGQGLIAQGALAIGTSCGFLSLYQRQLAAALAVPVATSSLLQISWLRALWPAREIGVITVDALALDRDHFEAVGVQEPVVVEGIDPNGRLARCLLDDEPALDMAAAEDETIDAARRLIARHPQAGAIVLECTNMPPYAAAVRRAIGRPVYDVVTMLNWLWAGMQGDAEVRARPWPAQLKP